MSSVQISNNTWFRRIHDTWANTSGWRTDISKNVLDDPNLKQAAFVLDDERALFVSILDLRNALHDCPIRSNGMIGPFNIDPHKSTVNGQHVTIEVRFPKKK